MKKKKRNRTINDDDRKIRDITIDVLNKMC